MVLLYEDHNNGDKGPSLCCSETESSRPAIGDFFVVHYRRLVQPWGEVRRRGAAHVDENEAKVLIFEAK